MSSVLAKRLDEELDLVARRNSLMMAGGKVSRSKLYV
jgi:hypothetical protein